MARDNHVAKSKKIRIYGMRCEICGYIPKNKYYLDIHHKIGVVDGGTNAEENLMMLCEKCHSDQHGYKKEKWIDQRCYEFHYGKD